MYLCDFHREQAWERWVKNKDNGVNVIKDEVLARLRRIATATTEQNFTEAVEALKASTVWEENTKLQSWMNTTWLPKYKVSPVLVNIQKIIANEHN